MVRPELLSALAKAIVALLALLHALGFAGPVDAFESLLLAVYALISGGNDARHWRANGGPHNHM